MDRKAAAQWKELSALYEVADGLAPEALPLWLERLRTLAHPRLAQLEGMLLARDRARDSDFMARLPNLSTQGTTAKNAGGDLIGRWQLAAPLAAGDIAAGWRAERAENGLRHQVMLELLHRRVPPHQRDAFMPAFASLRDLVASLRHPNIAALADAGVTTAGQPWLAFELVEGEPITIACDRQMLPVRERVRLMRQAVLALQHTHAKLLFHGDLKPAQILLGADGAVRVLGFGVAALAERSPHSGARFDAAQDVSALGAVLYELLCGKAPPSGVPPLAPSRRSLADSTAAARGCTAAALRRQLAGGLDAAVLDALNAQTATPPAALDSLLAGLDRWLARRWEFPWPWR